MQLEIRPDPTEVGRARKWARSRLAGLGIAADEPLAETLILLVSELVTNAVVHTGRPAVLRLSLPSGLPGGLPGGLPDGLPGGEAESDTAAPAPTGAEATGPAAEAAPSGTRGMRGAPGAPSASGTSGTASASGTPSTPGTSRAPGVPVAPDAHAAVPATVRLEVADTSSRAPVPRCAGGDATGGRGLALVDCLADRWGWSPEGAGKSIWCELDRCSRTEEGAEAAYGGGLAAYEDLAFETV